MTIELLNKKSKSNEELSWYFFIVELPNTKNLCSVPASSIIQSQTTGAQHRVHLASHLILRLLQNSGETLNLVQGTDVELGG